MPEITFCSFCLLQTLIMLVIANGAPIGADLILHQHYAYPVDGGLKLSDGHPLFGAAKTWRGLISSIFLVSLAALFLHMEILTGVWFALLTMMGDLLSSFCKRRLGLSESNRARGLDTVPESVLPALLLKEPLGLGGIEIIVLAITFLLIEEFLSPLLFRWHIRKNPY
jgi:CDP-2,3-bis-(O-geranylgeranyl)-sn-glycerol synthase